MAEPNVEFIESASEFARELANQLYAAKSDDDKDEALARLNRVLSDIVRAARGEEGGEVNVELDCCSVCYQKYWNNPPAYRNCMVNCNHGC